jgi:hypothetical protein
MIYNDLKKSYNVEDFKDFKDNLEKTILDFLINSFDSLSDEDFKKLTNKDTSKEDRFTIYNSFLENNKDKTQQIEIVLKEITEKLVNQLSDNVKKDYVVENIKLETEIPSLMENFTLAMYQSNNKLDKMSTQYDKRFIKVNNLEERKLRQDFLKSVYYQHIVKNKEWFCLISKQSETIDTQSETIDTQSETIDTLEEEKNTLKEEKNTLKEEYNIKNKIFNAQTDKLKKIKEKLLESKYININSIYDEEEEDYIEELEILNKTAIIKTFLENYSLEKIKKDYPQHYKMYKEEEELLRKEELQYMELLKENNKTEMVELIKNEIKKNGRNFNLASFVVELYLKDNVENKKIIEKQINNLKETQQMKILPKEMEEELNKQIVSLLNQVKENLNENEKEIIEDTIKNNTIKEEIKKSSSNLFK